MENEERRLDCGRARQLLGRDGARTRRDDVLIDHLAGCASCTAYRERLGFLSRAVDALPTAEPPSDLLPRLQAGLRSAERRRRRLVGLVRIALLAVAVAGMTLAAPALADADGPGGGVAVHAAHEIGAVEVALCLGLVATAVWPHRARGVLAVVASAAALLLVTASCDIAGGYTTAAHEADHGVVVLGALLVLLMSRLVPETAPPSRLPADRLSADDLDLVVDVDSHAAVPVGAATPAPMRSVA